MVDIDGLGGTNNGAKAVNARGQVVGVGSTSGDLLDRGFSWTRTGGMVELAPPAGYTMSEATALNARGDVVGLSSTADFSAIHATLWRTGGG